MDFDRMRALTRDLVAVDSVTGGEAAVASVFESVLADRGWTVEALPLEGEPGAGRRNLLARFEEEHPRILFNTHLDTVPEQYGPEIDSERLYGRGACDTKGLTAAMLEALETAQARGVDGLGLLLVVGEERDHIGAREAGAHPRLQAPEVLVVGEPTENAFLTAQKGILTARLRVEGQEGHSGYPERCDSAVERLLPVMEALRTAPWLERDSARGTTLNLSLLHGGDAYNKVPGSASCSLMFRLDVPVRDIMARTEELLARCGTGVRADWEPLAASEFLDGLDHLPGHPCGVAAFNTDLPYFGWSPPHRYLVGPGSIHQAHRDPVGGDRMRGEWIDLRAQEDGAELYLELIEHHAERP